MRILEIVVGWMDGGLWRIREREEERRGKEEGIGFCSADGIDGGIIYSVTFWSLPCLHC